MMAYSAQALTPFPGLQQMAVFSVVGLSASWLTVVLWFPLLTRAGDGQSLTLAKKLDQIRRLFPRVENSRILIALLAIIFVLAVKSLWGSSARDDVRLLQTSPDSLLAQEQVVQKTLGISSSSQFLLITGDSLERCLQTEESLIPGLEGLKNEGLLEGYQALSTVLPSLQRQADNSRLVRELYDRQLASFYAALNVSEKKLKIARHVLEQEQNTFLTSDSWLQSRASERWKDMIVMRTDQRVATVIRLTGMLDEAVKQDLMTLSAAVAGVTYVDKIQSISALIATYRSQIIEWIVMAYICVLIVLMYRYKKQTWRVVLPTLFASVVTLAILAQVEQGINLFTLWLYCWSWALASIWGYF